MNRPVIRIFADVDELSEAAAREFVRCAQTAIAAREVFTVVLAGGSTPRRLYQRLAQPPFQEMIDWTKVTCFWGDERPVPPTHNDSNYRMAHEALLHHVPIKESQIHRMK